MICNNAREELLSKVLLIPVGREGSAGDRDLVDGPHLSQNDPSPNVGTIQSSKCRELHGALLAHFEKGCQQVGIRHRRIVEDATRPVLFGCRSWHDRQATASSGGLSGSDWSRTTVDILAS